MITKDQALWFDELAYGSIAKTHFLTGKWSGYPTGVLFETVIRPPLLSALWMALGVGLLYDLFSGSEKLGSWAVAYTASLYLLSPLKRTFFEDSITTLPILTYLYSLLLTLWMLFPTFSFTDLFIYPLFDALFALVCFTLPMQLLPRPFRRAHFI